jgi:hypothetical protein
VSEDNKNSAEARWRIVEVAWVLTGENIPVVEDIRQGRDGRDLHRVDYRRNYWMIHRYFLYILDGRGDGVVEEGNLFLFWDILGDGWGVGVVGLLLRMQSMKMYDGKVGVG